jgi:hypothetical protein
LTIPDADFARLAVRLRRILARPHVQAVSVEVQDADRFALVVTEREYFPLGTPGKTRETVPDAV